MHYLVQEGTLIEDFETIGEWTVTGTGGLIASDAVNFKSGEKGLKITSVDAVSAYAKKTVSLNLSNVDRFSVWLYLDDYSNYSKTTQGLIYFYSGGDYFVYSINTRRLGTGWNKISFSKGDCTQSGSPSWATVDELRIRCLSDSGKTAQVTVDSFKTNEYSRPKVIFTFDDGNLTDYSEAFSYMKLKGIKGTLFIYSTGIGTAGKPTVAQIQEMCDAGWDISNHSDDGESLEGLAESEVSTHLLNNINYVINQGWNRKNSAYFLAWPLSAIDINSLGGAFNTGILAARTGYPATEPHANPQMLLKARREPVSDSTVDEVKGWVDNGVANGGAVILNFHEIVTPKVGATDVTPDDFKAIVDYCYKFMLGNVIDIVTLTEWYRGLTEPRRNV